MREDTIRRKKASRLLKAMEGGEWLVGRVAQILSQGKRGLDGLVIELGRMVAEAIMYVEREEVDGPDYRPYRSEVRAWASQPGSIFVGSYNTACLPSESSRKRIFLACLDTGEGRISSCWWHQGDGHPSSYSNSVKAGVDINGRHVHP